MRCFVTVFELLIHIFSALADDMGPLGSTKGHAQLIRQNNYSLT